jgi:bifunctional non-homologous end joining protein LigD
MIAKRKKSKYLIGKRTTDWLKIKNVQSQEAIIIGFTEPKGSRNAFGSLLLGMWKDDDLVSIGNVGTGFTDQSLKELHTKLKKIVRKTSPLDIPIKETPDITWVSLCWCVISSLRRSPTTAAYVTRFFWDYGLIRVQRMS